MLLRPVLMAQNTYKWQSPRMVPVDSPNYGWGHT